CLFGPSAAGGAYIPAFCDVVFMVEKNASMYLGSPRMAEEVIGEKVSLEEMGGARMHSEVSGSGDLLVSDDKAAIEAARAYLMYFPQNYTQAPPREEARPPAYRGSLASIVPGDESKPFDMYSLVAGLVDEDSFFEIKPDFAREVICGLGRLAGDVVGVVANQPAHLGGVLFVDSADKVARFVWLCDAFNIPLVFLADVPGFMIGSAVERQGIIRHGAKLITAVSEATVPKLSVIVRKAYGAGLYAMAGPGFDPDVTIALPTARIAVMGPEPALNAISGGLADQLAGAFVAAAADPNAWVVVLAAAGDRAFCVGADLKERGQLDDRGWMRNRVLIRGLFEAIRSAPQPTIASVFGYALGGGFELALSCDLIVASEDAVLGLPEVRVGILPGGGGTQLLARRVGPGRAKEMIFTG